MIKEEMVRKSANLSTVLILVATTACWLTMVLNSYAGSAADSQGNIRPNCIAGTYLIEEGSGTQSLWSFSEDGLVFGTSSAQSLLSFTNQQGVWRSTGKRNATATILDFSFDGDGQLKNTGRVDISIDFADRDCDRIYGEFSVRFFEPGEDPLDPRTDTGEPLTDTFVGRRVKVNQNRMFNRK